MRTQLVGMLVAVVVLGPAGWADITGQVVDPTGKPVAGATVWVASALPARLGEHGSAAKTTTGADGRFALASSREWLIPVVVATADGWGLAWSEAGTEPDETRLALAPPTELQLQVVDEHDAPVVGLEVRVAQLRFPAVKLSYCELPAAAGLFSGRTDADGRIRFAGLPQGAECWIEIVSDVYAPFDIVEGRAELAAGPVTAAAPLRVLRMASISGRVVDGATGQPAAAVKVLCHVYGRFTLPDDSATAVTDADGNYRLTRVAPGLCWVNVRPTAAQREKWVPAARDSLAVSPGQAYENVDLRLEEGVALTVKVVAKGTGLPAAGVEVVVAGPQCPEQVASREPGRTHADGTYTERVLPGEQVVTARDRDNWPDLETALRGGQAQTLTVTAGQPATVELAMERRSADGAILVKVVGPDGQPVAGAVVVVGSPGFGWPDEPERDTTNDLGELLLSRIMFRPPLTLRARKGEQGTLEATTVQSGDAPVLRLADHAMASLTVRVADEQGRPMARAQVSLYDDTRQFAGEAGQAVTDARGEATIPDCWPGLRYRITARAKGYGNAYADPFTLAPGQHADIGALRLPLANATLEGWVFDEQDKPVPLADVIVVGGPTAYARVVTKADGSFRFEGIVAGPVHLHALTPDRKLEGWLDTTTDAVQPVVRVKPRQPGR